jgi:hypothetical protein
MNEVVESPFAGSGTRAVAQHGSAAAVANSNREVAEVQALLLMAQLHPRNQVAAMDRIINAFTRPTLAEVAKYQYSKGGTDIDGPSIRSAEAIAQMWGNMDFGFHELSRGVGERGVPYSEVRAYAIDLETRTRRTLTFVAPHWRDTKKGGYALNDERDIYELMSNMAQRRVRACILAIVPGDVTEAAMKQAEVTLKSKADTSPEGQAKLVEAFAPFGVTKAHIEKRIQRRLEAIVPAQVVHLKKVYASIRDGMSTAEEWFDIEPAPAGTEGAAPAEKPAYPDELFKKNVENWRAMIQSGKKTVEQIVAMVASKGALTEDQVKQLSAPAEQPVVRTDDQVALDYIRQKAKLAAISDADIAKHLGLAKLEDIAPAQVDAALAFIEDPISASKGGK